jgi:hypothetical protein
MSLIYDLKLFEKELNKRISISITFFDKSVNSWQTEFIQGVLKTVDVENDIIEIEQHFPFINYISNLETQTIIRTFKNREFFMIECGDLKTSK